MKDDLSSWVMKRTVVGVHDKTTTPTASTKHGRLLESSFYCGRMQPPSWSPPPLLIPRFVSRLAVIVTQYHKVNTLARKSLFTSGEIHESSIMFLGQPYHDVFQ